MAPVVSPMSLDHEIDESKSTVVNSSDDVVVPVRMEEDEFEAVASISEAKAPFLTPIILVSEGRSGCEDDSRGETRSLSDDDEDKANNHSGDTTEATEPLSVESSSPLDTHDNGNSDVTVPLRAPNEVANSCSSSPATGYFRLNAFEHDSDDTDSEEDFPNKAAGTLENHDNTKTITTTPSSDAQYINKQQHRRRGVRFGNVCIREYDITIGENPYCSYGVPICLDWSHGEDEVIPVDFFEASHKTRRNTRRMLLNSFQRRDMLWRSGYELEDIEKAIKANDREKFRRSVTVYLLPLYMLQEVLYFGVDRCFATSRDNDAQLVEQMVQEQQSRELQMKLNDSDAEVGTMSGGNNDWERDRPFRRLSFRSTQESRAGASLENFPSGAAEESLHSLERDDPYAASTNSIFREYAVRVDRGQHDKAAEIILCNIQRPHMRAFHASWFSFFVAFFIWFAITPLLGEIKDTLKLSNDDIWKSSLCGTAGVIIMRIFMGPACDKFGSRICMAYILAAASIPCALTGLVETAQGLSILRTFVGIAGSSFVACQYWTSQMFTREVAGTANAIVAGWGNLGGGIAQIIMGSVLFPLFKLLFSYEDNDGDDGTTSSEMAWRTVFVVPAVVALVTAYTIVFHCDDSPKGAYVERVRQQEIMVVSPVASLCAAAQKRNVWILFCQYACCFGVEVTMTNATALYLRDEFGQSTASAAAIASTFGFMNIFARGLGGFGSDLFNAKYGMRGRILWQTVNLFLEGISIIIFGYCQTLAGSIVALIFCSLMVQSTEGSTFGIVPYVDRRFTGAVVGVVGAGGNVGGVIFSIFFIQYDYEKAFLVMGALAAAVSVLSGFIDCSKLARNAETLVDENSREETILQHNEGIGLTRDTTITFAQLDKHEQGR